MVRREILVKMILQKPKWRIDVMCWDYKIKIEENREKLAEKLADAIIGLDQQN